jgi:serine/threonine protein kinase
MKTHLGHYEIVAELGRGGMGVVYKGYEPSLGRHVAIKELSAALAHDAPVVERFLREARAMALLNDPHIIQIYAIGQDNDQPFFVMEFVEGASVAGLIKRDGRLGVGDALKITHQTAQGLAAAHGKGVIHRDVKPANLMLNDRGLIKIADFGIALANKDVDTKLTSAGELVGTPGYLSPEILLGNPVDERSDLYALGVVLFEMLIGRTPFSDVSVYKLLQAVVETPVPDIREIDAGIDADTAAIVARMLAKDPIERYQNMHALIADLEKHPLVARGGAIEVHVSPDEGVAENIVEMTMVSVTPHTPSSSARVHTPLPNLGRHTPLPDLGRRTPPTPSEFVLPVVPSPPRTADSPERRKPDSGRVSPAKTEPPAPTPAKKLPMPMLIAVAAVLLIAVAGWFFRGSLFESDAGGAASTTAAQTAKARAAARLGDIAAIAVTVAGLAITGFWFGVHRRRRAESAAGVQCLANLKWRDCIGLVLEAMRREGYEEAPSSRQPGGGDTEFLLLSNNKPVLLDYKHGTAYRIGEVNVRDFASSVHLQGAETGILVTLGQADGSARDAARRYSIELIDGAALWPKLRQFVSPDIQDHVSLLAGAQTRKGLWTGFAVSLLLGAMIFLSTQQVSPSSPQASVVATTAASVPQPVPAQEDANASQAPSTSQRVDTAATVDPALKQINAAAEAMAKVAKLTDAERVQRRAEAARKMTSIMQIATAGWSTQSTLVLSLRTSDGTDTGLLGEVCRILTQYEELRYTRLQLQPPETAHLPVRWRQCQ